MKIKNILSALAIATIAATGASAATINVGEVSGSFSAGGSLESGGMDVYNFSIADGGSYLTINVGADGSDIDTHIGLYNSDGYRVARNDDGGRGLNSRLRFGGTSSRDMLAAGDYTLAVSSFWTDFTRLFRNITPGDGQGGDYFVRIRTDAPETDVAAVPLPAGGLLLLTGLLGLAAARRKRSA